MQHTEMVTLVSWTTITGASGQALSVSPLEILSLSRFISFSSYRQHAEPLGPRQLSLSYALRSMSRSAVSSAEPEVGRSSVAGVLVARAMPSLASLTSRHLSLKRLGGVWASCGFALIDIYTSSLFELINLYNLLDP